MEMLKIIVGTVLLLLVALLPFGAWQLGRKHGWLKIASGGALLVGFMVYRSHVTSMRSIGRGWALSLEPALIEAGGGNQRLYRVSRFRRKKIEVLIREHQHYRPDCVGYRSSRMAIKGQLFVVCGDRTPVAVDTYYALAPDGLRDEETFRLDDFRERVHYRIIPADRLLALAARQPRYTRQRYRMAQAERGVQLQVIAESTVVRAVSSVPR